MGHPKGLGRMLMEKMINYCRSRGTKRMFGQVLKENTPMLSLAEQLRFKRTFDSKESVWELILNL